jgi:PilZ domain
MSSQSQEHRRFPRIHLQVPMFVRGTDSNGDEFLELAKTLDLSAGGALLASTRSLRANDLILLTIPAPPPLSAGLMASSTAPISARVRRSQASADAHLVGVEFLRPLD